MREDRLTQMESYIREKRSVSLDTLCDEFHVSKNTVRRDINEIVARSDIRKTYGGVSIQYNKIPPPFSERSGVNQLAKERIGKRAAEFVNDGDIIYVDSGTTTRHLVEYLQGRRDITVLTHSLDVINRAVVNTELNIMSLSGALNRKTFSFTGQSTIDMLNDCNISKAFMSATGITAQTGATQSTSIEFAIKKCIVARSESVYLMVENSKFGAVSLLTYARLDEIDTIITQKMPSPEFVNAFANVGGRIVLAEE